MAPMINMPASPVMSLTTCVSFPSAEANRERWLRRGSVFFPSVPYLTLAGVVSAS